MWGNGNWGSFYGNITHWVCYYNNDKIKYYFHSYGDTTLKPLKELVHYLGNIDNYSISYKAKL